MDLRICVREFFNQYLTEVKGVSEQTIQGYKYTFKLFLPFASRYLGKKAGYIKLTDLSTDLVLSFLDSLETERGNCRKTRNVRLAAIKSLARMIRLMHPEYRDVTDRILNIPQKREQKPLVGFLSHDEILAVFNSADMRKKHGFRDYTMLHVLFDAGVRASELAGLNIDSINSEEKTLGILGKGGRYRLVQLESMTSGLIEKYISDYRPTPIATYKDRLFINQRGEGFTRHGVYRMCLRHLQKVIPAKRLKTLNAAHCFRHSCAVHMLMTGHSIADIRNHLGHEDSQTTSIYLKIDLSRRRNVQEKFINHMKSTIKDDPKIDELIDWENKEQLCEWPDRL